MWPDEREGLERMLHDHGLTAIQTAKLDTQNPEFTAIVEDMPSCSVGGWQSYSSERWILNGYKGEWYGDRFDEWPPGDITVAQVARDHPEICNS